MNVRDIIKQRTVVLKKLKNFHGKALPQSSCDMSATVWVTDDAVKRVLTMDDGMPADTVEYPPIEGWPWAARSAMLIHESPVNLQFYISSTGRDYTRANFLDNQDVQAHLMIPPGIGVYGEIEYRGEGEAPPGMVELWEERKRTQIGIVVAVHDSAISTGYVPFGIKSSTGGNHASTTSSDRFNANLARAIMTRLIVVTKPKLTDGERWRVTCSAGTTLEVLDIPRVGSTVASPVAAVFKHRDHFTQSGVPKKALTPAHAETLCLEYDYLESYTCPVCSRIHVGNRR